MLLAGLACGCADPGPGPHVVLLTVDTLRADRLGLYGYERETTPRLDAWFGRGTVFESASSSAPCTDPSVLQYLAGGFDARDDRRVLAEHLRDAGYRTAAVVSQHLFHGEREAYARGFAHFDLQPREQVDVHGWTARGAGEVSDRAIAWLEAHADEPKLFLWLHYFDPHDPYEPPAAHRSFDAGNTSRRSGDRRSYQRKSRRPPGELFDAADVAHFRNLYDGEVRYVDEEIGRVLDRLEGLGLAERSIVVLTADHGEWLGEGDRWDHCQGVSDTEVRVPLLFRVDGGGLGAEARVREPASTLDVLPTVLGLLGLPYEAAAYHGVDLRQPPADRVVVSMWADELAVRDAEWKLVLRDDAPHRLYWTARDPEERWNRLIDAAAERERLVGRAPPYQALHEARQFGKIQEALRGLGYIE